MNQYLVEQYKKLGLSDAVIAFGEKSINPLKQDKSIIRITSIFFFRFSRYAQHQVTTGISRCGTTL